MESSRPRRGGKPESQQTPERMLESMLTRFLFLEFKSFLHGELPLQPLTTLLGRNASGKSNAVEGMRILSELARGKELSAVLDGVRGGSRGCCRGEGSVFGLGCEVRTEEREALRYRVHIQVADRARIGWESLARLSPDGGETVLFETDSPAPEAEWIAAKWLTPDSPGADPAGILEKETLEYLAAFVQSGRRMQELAKQEYARVRKRQEQYVPRTAQEAEAWEEQLTRLGELEAAVAKNETFLQTVEADCQHRYEQWQKKQSAAPLLDTIQVVDMPQIETTVRFSRDVSVLSQIKAKLPQGAADYDAILSACEQVSDHLKKMRFLAPIPERMGDYAPMEDSLLRVDGSNLSAVLYRLCQDAAVKAELTALMRELPENEIRDITFALGPRDDVLLFLEEQCGREALRLDASRLSGGTLRCLAVLAAALSEEAGATLVVEEADNGLHAGRAGALANILSRKARERGLTVVLTTHSVPFLNSLSREDLYGADIVYRDPETGDSRVLSLTEVPDMGRLLAEGRLGDAAESGRLLDYIKKPRSAPDLSWLED